MTYRCAMVKGETFRNTEFFVFDGERVKSIDVYFGASYSDDKFVKQKDRRRASRRVERAANRATASNNWRLS